jgi:hypothetical protein
VTAWLIVVGIILAVLLPTLYRLHNLNQVPVLVWPGALLSAAFPLAVLYTLILPGPAVSTATVAQLHGKATLELPPGHVILATATLTPADEEAQNHNKTSYTLKFDGADWSQTGSATVARENAGGGPDIDVVDGAGVVDRATRRSGGFGEDLEERFELRGSGPVTVEVTNWEGTAARLIELSVVKAPPPEWSLWIVAVLISLLALYLEVFRGIERIASDLAFLGFYGVFLRHRVTPLDSFGEVLGAALPAALLGWGVVAGLAYLIVKMQSRTEAVAPAADGAAPAEVEAPGRRLKKRR